MGKTKGKKAPARRFNGFVCTLVEDGDWKLDFHVYSEGFMLKIGNQTKYYSCLRHIFEAALDLCVARKLLQSRYNMQKLLDTLESARLEVTEAAGLLEGYLK